VPPSDLSSDLAKLLLDNNNNGAPPPPPDVTLVVGSQSFGAHSFVLWARCPKLYDRVTSWKILVVAASEVHPAVFKALLHYIYTDSLPAMDGPSKTKTETVRGLLAAADQYGIERLKLICERALCASLDAGTVAATLGLAERLQCPALRRACTQFIGGTAKQDTSTR
jgi:speckle-type POZ protein